MMRPYIQLLSAFLAAASLFGVAHALGPEGHALVAVMAERNLQPAPMKEAQRLLAPEITKKLDQISSWAMTGGQIMARRRPITWWCPVVRSKLR